MAQVGEPGCSNRLDGHSSRLAALIPPGWLQPGLCQGGGLGGTHTMLPPPPAPSHPQHQHFILSPPKPPTQLNPPRRPALPTSPSSTDPPTGVRHDRGVRHGVHRPRLGGRLLLPLPRLEGTLPICQETLLRYRYRGVWGGELWGEHRFGDLQCHPHHGCLRKARTP